MKGFSEKQPKRLLWLSNVALPGAFSEEEGKPPVICGWVNSLAEKLKYRPDIRLSVLYPQELFRETRIRQTDGIRHIGFYEPADPLLSYPDWLESCFRQILEEEKPDLIHIWGTEYVHSLALFRAFGRPERVLISIQGLISVYAGHYFADVPEKLLGAYTLRDLIHRDNLREQKRKYALRGEFEQALLKEARHVAGRTSWDKTHTKRLSPQALYHHCDELLREEFYSPPSWRYGSCEPHTLFASQFYYPIKGLHQLLLAMPKVLQAYPDARLRVSGGGIIFPRDLKGKLRESAYPKYLERLIKELELKDKVEFLGNLDAGRMKAEYLRANVFALPSAVENSPNSLAEAMLLGTPVVSADVGGVRDMLGELSEGSVYPFSDTALLAERIRAIFALGEKAEATGEREKAAALLRHDPERCLMQYLEAYGRILE